MKLNILAFAAHPDDTELGCAGTLALHIASGFKVGVVDLTRGELGTRGSSEVRLQEAQDASKILGLAVRENLGMADGFFEDNRENQLKIIKAIRTYRPDIIIGTAINDRHPDHERAAAVLKTAWFLAGLQRIKTTVNGKEQQAYRPGAFYHYIQSLYIQPDFIVDISEYWDIKIEAIRAFKSQFYNPDSKEPETFISSPGFLPALEARAREFGYSIDAKYGEGFTTIRNIGVRSLYDLR